MPARLEIIPAEHPRALSRAQNALQNGNLAAFPTDTVYGVGVMVSNTAGIDRLYEIKDRDRSKAIAILVADPSQLSLLTQDLNDNARRLAEHFWPGALTLVVSRHPQLPQNLSPLPTIGIRMPDYFFAQELMKLCGPLATTSANLSGQPDSQSAADVLTQIGRHIELLIDGGRAPGGVPSTVVDCTQPEPVILRQGTIDAEAIRAALAT